MYINVSDSDFNYGLVFEVEAYCKKKGIELPRAIVKTQIYQRAKSLKRYYNMSLEEYDNLLEAQSHLCAICKQKQIGNNRWGKLEFLSVDHCHVTKKVRGLLCTDCNYALGRFKENIIFLKNAITYL